MTAPAGEWFYLTLDVVREIHTEAIESFGGSHGIRDQTLLESAIAAPRASMMGQPLFTDPAEIAAAYLFYLCRNHPFVDGNKRAALGACLVFLKLNGFKPHRDGPEWEALTLDVAASRLDRDQTTQRLRALLPSGS